MSINQYRSNFENHVCRLILDTIFNIFSRANFCDRPYHHTITITPQLLAFFLAFFLFLRVNDETCLLEQYLKIQNNHIVRVFWCFLDRTLVGLGLGSFRKQQLRVTAVQGVLIMRMAGFFPPCAVNCCTERTKVPINSLTCRFCDDAKVK